jgi:hypothetical protein
MRELPEPIPTYLAAHVARDADAAVPCFTDDAVVVDDGGTHRGPARIRDWLARAASEYTYTTELVGASRLDDGRYDAVHHLEGDFPGGAVDLHFRFTLRDGRIARLVIEP